MPLYSQSVRILIFLELCFVFVAYENTRTIIGIYEVDSRYVYTNLCIYDTFQTVKNGERKGKARENFVKS